MSRLIGIVMLLAILTTACNIFYPKTIDIVLALAGVISLITIIAIPVTLIIKGDT